MAAKGFKDFARFISAVERNALNSRQMFRLGRIQKNIIRKRVKTGKGVNDEGSKNPSINRLKPLSPNYIKQRRKSTLGEFGAPTRSNLTFTGQLLDSFKIESSKGTFSVIIPNTLRKSKRGSKGKSLTNAQVAAKVRQLRPFFALALPERKILTREVEKLVRKEFKKIF